MSSRLKPASNLNRWPDTTPRETIGAIHRWSGDSFVVDATDFLESHPGGLKKLLSTDSPGAGASGQPYGFSFSRGRNAHFPDTGKRFMKGVERYLGGAASGSDSWLPPSDVAFPRYGRLVILGKLKST